MHSAIRAGPLAVFQRQLFFAAHDMATDMAGLCRVPRVDGDEFPAIKCGLVGQEIEVNIPAFESHPISS